jgi:hypothetical protein
MMIIIIIIIISRKLAGKIRYYPVLQHAPN